MQKYNVPTDTETLRINIFWDKILYFEVNKGYTGSCVDKKIIVEIFMCYFIPTHVSSAWFFIFAYGFRKWLFYVGHQGTPNESTSKHPTSVYKYIRTYSVNSEEG